MAVSFYRLGATPRLLSNGTRKFERGVSKESHDIILLPLVSLFFSRHFILPPSLYLYRDYSQSWSTSGCVQKADCDSPGYADQATCCAAHFGGQTGGACSTVAGSAAPTPANPNIGKFYADYSTPWPEAGCKNTVPHPIYATTFFTTQLECCKASFGGQTSNACVMGLPNPPTAKPSVAPTTVAPTTKSPTTAAGQGGGWYADYAISSWCDPATPVLWHP